MVTKKVWIDTDLAVGMRHHIRDGYSDVDDGYAILQLFKSPKVEVVGMSAVFGNTLLENAYELCEKMVNEFAPYTIPVYKGAAQAIQLDDIQTNDAVEGLAKALQESPLTIMAIGPATNVGILLLKYPELASQIKEVVLVAGRRSQDDHFKIGDKGRIAPDLNFDLDNEAFRLMFQYKLPITLCPFEISHKVWITEQDLDTLSQGDVALQWLAQHSRPWLAQWEEQGAIGFNPFDVLASHYIISPKDIISENLNARMEVYANDMDIQRSENSYKHYLICDANSGSTIKYCYDITAQYHTELIKSLIGS